MAQKTNMIYDSAIGDKANTKLSKRLQDVISDPKALAKHLGVSVQAINQYKQGTAFPKVENLIKIADYYNISLDYLIGITDTKNRNTTMQAVCEYTGLSEDSIAFLNRMKLSFIPRMIDFIIDDTRIQDVSPDTLLKLLHFFLDYEGGNYPTQRINIYGDISKSPLPKNGIRTDTIMLDESIIENAVLEEIKKRLLKQKEGYKNGKH